MAGPIRLGDIEFFNTWPVTHALRTGAIKADVKLVPGTPAVLNRKLLAGELDASAVSTALFLRHQRELVPIPQVCIRSDEGVQSVVLISRDHVADLGRQTIAISNQGATTPILLKVLLAHHRIPARFEVTDLRYPAILGKYSAALVIGDEALQAAQELDGDKWHTWDLGQAWNNWTKLPFVYAVWVLRRNLENTDPLLLEHLRELLQRSYEWGKSHTAQLVAAMRKTAPWEANFLRRYLGLLSYEWDARAWAGLKRFAREGEAIGEFPKGTSAEFNRISLDNFVGVK